MGMMLDVMLISSLMHMMHMPMLHVVTPSGASVGSAADVAQNPGLAEETNDGGDFGGNDVEGDDIGGGDDLGGGDDFGGDFGSFD